MQGKRLYHAGIYLRLSRDDAAGGGRFESDSIGSQRELCLAYIRGREDMEVYDIYVDDGYSGANFKRPGFQRMMEDIYAGKVDCVVVKDLSRFGREYIEAGRLLQKTFPALNVRFVAVTDRFDSLTADYNETSLVLPVKNFVNDAYCRDISDKVKSHQRIKRERGEFIGAFTVYGYQREPGRKGHLVPDEEAAEVVRWIFAWKTEGMSTAAIAKRLNDMGILSPLEQKKARGEHYATSFATGVRADWSAVAVRRILVNEIYAGTLEQGKSEKVSVKVNRYRTKPREEWSRVEDAHQAIVSREEFERVQRLLTMDSRASRGTERAHLFSGVLFCGDCGAAMTRRVSRYRGEERVSFICSTRNKGRGCTRHRILAEELKEAVFAGLRLQAELRTNWEMVSRAVAELSNEMRRTGQEGKERLDREIERQEKERERCLVLQKSLDEDLRNGVITEEDFRMLRRIYREKALKTAKAAEGQESFKRSREQAAADARDRLRRFGEAKTLTELDRNALTVFVRRIDVYEGKKIRLELDCKDKDV